jgi:hypothetical protein
VLRAVNLAESAVYALFDDPEFVWGPKLVAVAVDGPGLEKPVVVWVGNQDQPWQEDWGPQEQFRGIALWKVAAALDAGMPTAMLVHNHPLLLEDGDFLYEGGVCDLSKQIGVAASGIKGRGDEAVAKIVLAIMEALAHLQVASMKEQDIDQVQ